MKLYILRHGIAIQPGAPGYEDDSARPLTPKGKRQLRQTAAAMKRMGLRFDGILSSPYLRAKQTAEIVAKPLKLGKKLVFSDELTPGGSPRALIQQLNAARLKSNAILLVGHEPYLSRLISTLTTGDMHLAMDFKKGGLCKLAADKLSVGRCATLVWVLTPRQMKLMC